ncbi:hypothetical protein [Xanthomarina sp. F2636L]|uniref:hypothetical protein n=1 Tax=Xanthomarina sp. F2636L TaxID=2996018 RepID=UPI00225E635B|nr:hypothetical protein [Xanthomarina sp. F2636L]MCX7551596.1 hypothetical protein [Xanthomarina sp. F2636L]
MKTTNQFHLNSNTLNMVNKTLKTFFGTALMASLIFTSCSPNEDVNYIPTSGPDRPTAQEFSNIRHQALENITQNFQFNADDGFITLTSTHGVSISIDGNCLTKNGNAVTGMVDLEYVEVFEKGNMITTNKPTMGIMPNGDKALLLTGGEFFLEATQDGVTLETNCVMQLEVPTALTGGADNAMILWYGNIDEDGNLAWEEAEAEPGTDGENTVFTDPTNYYVMFNQFGWTNIDRFYNDPRPKTTINVTVPIGFNNTNSGVYLSYDGEDSGLAQLDAYDPISGKFSEHYGQIPIGLECHLIFVTEEDGNWRYAVKPVTIAADGSTVFSLSETSIATENELILQINNLP